MTRNTLLLSATSLLGAACFAGAQPDRSAEIKISLSDSSIKVGDTELRTGPSVGKARYISKKAAEKVFGSVADEYSPGRVIVYAWPNLGGADPRGPTRVQRGQDI